MIGLSIKDAPRWIRMGNLHSTSENQEGARATPTKARGDRNVRYQTRKTPLRVLRYVITQTSIKNISTGSL